MKTVIIVKIWIILSILSNIIPVCISNISQYQIVENNKQLLFKGYKLCAVTATDYCLLCNYDCLMRNVSIVTNLIDVTETDTDIESCQLHCDEDKYIWNI